MNQTNRRLKDSLNPDLKSWFVKPSNTRPAATLEGAVNDEDDVPLAVKVAALLGPVALAGIMHLAGSEAKRSSPEDVSTQPALVEETESAEDRYLRSLLDPTVPAEDLDVLRDSLSHIQR